ncbi:MAG: cyclic nucleotide-binding domain-containing protein [Cellvibrionaceae bacterium]
MEIKQIKEFPRDNLEQLLSAIPFYKDVKQQDFWQFELLLAHSRLVSYEPGETALRSGETDSWLYFLLKGQLAVFVGKETEETKAVNYITPGEVFGDIALLLGNERTATLIADANCRQILAFATDFTVFGELNDFRSISLPTKLIYYRNTVHNLRWKLEVYRTKYPDDDLAGDHHRIKLYVGTKDSFEELASLHEQGVALAQQLVKWNARFGVPSFNEGGSIDPSLVANIV